MLTCSFLCKLIPTYSLGVCSKKPSVVDLWCEDSVRAYIALGSKQTRNQCNLWPMREMSARQESSVRSAHKWRNSEVLHTMLSEVCTVKKMKASAPAYATERSWMPVDTSSSLAPKCRLTACLLVLLLRMISLLLWDRRPHRTTV